LLFATFLGGNSLINPWRGLGRLPKEMWVLFAVTLTNRIGTMALPFMVLYLTKELAYSDAKAGLILMVYGIGAIITSPLSGKLCDSIGAVRVMKWSLLLSGAVLLLLPLTQNIFAITSLVFIWAIFSEAFRPASYTIISDVVAPEQRKSAFALSRLAINLGMSIGPVIGGLLTMVSYTAIFFVDGITSIVAGVLLVVAHLQMTAQVDKAKASQVVETHATNRASALRDFRLLYFLLAMIPVELVMFQTQAAMPLYMVRDLKFTEAVYGLLMAINTVLIIFLEVPLTLAIEHWSNRLALGLGSLFFALGFGALAIATDTLGVGATIIVWTLGEMILFPGASAYMAEVAPPEKRGEYMGLYLMTFSIAFAIAPWLGTVILDRFGPGTLWISTFVGGSVSAAMMLALKHQRREVNLSMAD
jgi:predicted MFS family arabinose efflux permease